jgi:hypothetical protein
LSDLRTLPPDVEKVWITVDLSLISVVIKVLKGFFNREKEGRGNDAIYYTQI